MKIIDLIGVPSLEEKAREYFVSYSAQMASHVDHMMAGLLAAEWLGSIVVALTISPWTWSGSQSHLHPHVWIALLLGPAIVCGPIALALFYPARIFTRHVIATAQISMSILLIDITGGRIETHFHVFGSLAFLAFYRDWRVLITASALTALDHIVRGIWWPQSVYGMLTVSPWRWVEHAWWVIFEDFFLILSCRRSIQEMWAMAIREAQLSYGAYCDVLTGLANRRLLVDRFDRTFAEALAAGKKGAVLFLDLDRFKQVNDTLGHTIGDKLLVQVSKRFSSALSEDDTLARIGGDEFVVVVENLSSVSQAEEIGGRLLGIFNLPFTVEDHHLLLSASVGISLFPEHGSDLPSLQEAADVAMYEAKAEGRDRCTVFLPEMTTRGQTRQELERDLYHAIARRELELYYQPQVALDGQVSGF